MGRPNLAELMSLVPKDIINEAYEWALEESKPWPHGTYSPNDFPTMYQKGYLAGYIKANAQAVDRPVMPEKILCEQLWEHKPGCTCIRSNIANSEENSS